MYSRKNVAMKISLKMEAILHFNVSNVDVFLNSTVVCFGKIFLLFFSTAYFRSHHGQLLSLSLHDTALSMPEYKLRKCLKLLSRIHGSAWKVKLSFTEHPH